MKFILDTSACVDALRHRPRTLRWLDPLPAGAAVVSAIAVAELEVGIFKAGNKPADRRQLAAFLRKFRPLDFDLAAAREAGRIAAALGINNNPTGYRDALIAGHAVSRRLTVATCNPADFWKAPGVKVLALTEAG